MTCFLTKIDHKIEIITYFIKPNLFYFLIFRYSNGVVTDYPHQSHHYHYMTSVAKVDETALAIGDGWDGNKKVEKLTTTGWKELADYPVTDYIWGYSAVNLNGQLYIFGKIEIYIFKNNILFKAERLEFIKRLI